MSRRFTLAEMTSEQRRAAMDMAKIAAGVGNIPDANLTPMALFLMSAIANECCSKVFHHVPATITPPPEPAPDMPFSVEGL